MDCIEHPFFFDVEYSILGIDCFLMFLDIDFIAPVKVNYSFIGTCHVNFKNTQAAEIAIAMSEDNPYGMTIFLNFS
jgi:hypothetical protein